MSDNLGDIPLYDAFPSPDDVFKSIRETWPTPLTELQMAGLELVQRYYSVMEDALNMLDDTTYDDLMGRACMKVLGIDFNGEDVVQQ